MLTDVTEVRAASIIRLMSDSLITLMIEAARTSETSADIRLRTRQYIPEDSELLAIFIVRVEEVRVRLLTAGSKGHIFLAQVMYEYEKHQWNTDRGKTEELGEKSVPVPLCPPQISHKLTGA
jgi:hypothetical protein